MIILYCQYSSSIKVDGTPIVLSKEQFLKFDPSIMPTFGGVIIVVSEEQLLKASAPIPSTDHGSSIDANDMRLAKLCSIFNRIIKHELINCIQRSNMIQFFEHMNLLLFSSLIYIYKRHIVLFHSLNMYSKSPHLVI